MTTCTCRPKLIGARNLLNAAEYYMVRYDQKLAVIASLCLRLLATEISTHKNV